MVQSQIQASLALPVPGHAAAANKGVAAEQHALSPRCGPAQHGVAAKGVADGDGAGATPNCPAACGAGSWGSCQLVVRTVAMGGTRSGAASASNCARVSGVGSHGSMRTVPPAVTRMYAWAAPNMPFLGSKRWLVTRTSVGAAAPPSSMRISVERFYPPSGVGHSAGAAGAGGSIVSADIRCSSWRRGPAVRPP